MDARLAAIYEIQDQLKDCWKFLTENRFSMKLKKLKKKVVGLNTKKVRAIIELLEIYDQPFVFDPYKELGKGDFSVDKLFLRINSAIEDTY